MENKNYEVDRYRHTIKNWWIMMLLGIATFIIGITVFRYPGESYMALAYTFAFLIIATSIMQLYLAYYTPAHAGRGWLIAGGVIELLLGILLLSRPEALIAVMPFLLGFWLLFRSVSLIGTSSDMMAMNIKGSGWIIALAIVLMLCAFMILFNPIIGVGAIVVWIGISFILAGIAMTVFSIHLMRIRKYFK